MLWAVSSDRDSDPSVQRACNFQPHPHTSIPKDCGVKEKKICMKKRGLSIPILGSQTSALSKGGLRGSTGGAEGLPRAQSRPLRDRETDWSPRHRVTLPSTTVTQLHRSPSFHRTTPVLSGLPLHSEACQTAAIKSNRKLLI